MDVVRRSVERARNKTGSRKGNPDAVDPGQEDSCRKESEGKANGTPGAPACIEISYLLVSPLVSPLSSMLFMGSLFSSRQSHAAQDELADRRTLAVYGDEDVFSSQRKLRRWAEGLRGRQDSKFRFEEIAGAGHFWRENGVLQQLLEAVSEWV